jgi:hypothetical protein
MPTLTDTTLVIRCPYCLVGIGHRPMIAYKDGRFVCRDCAHTVRPGASEYKCACRPCLRVAQGDDARRVRPSVGTSYGQDIPVCYGSVTRMVLASFGTHPVLRSRVLVLPSVK